MAQNFTADGSHRKWGADISYIGTAEGWLYLAVVLDLFSRRVVGWAASDRLKRDLAVEALRRALAARNPAPGLVHHSDRGSQYCSVDYQALLRKRGILISMSGCRVAFKSGTPRVERRMLPLNVTFRRQLVGVFPCFALQSGQLLQEAGAPFQTHEARQLLRTHLGQC